MSTGFRVPVMPLTCNVWHQPNAPPAAPDLVTPCQLRGPSIHTSGTTQQGANDVGTPTLLVSAFTDLRDTNNASNFDTVEIPAGSGRFYIVLMVEDVAKGFLNEHRMAFIRKSGTWPTPIP